MATPTAIAIRQETAAARIEAAARTLGIDGAMNSQARDPETRIAEILEYAAALVEAVAARQTPPAAPSEAGPKPRSKTT